MPDYLQMAIDEGRFEGSENRAGDMEAYVRSKQGGSGGSGGNAYDDLANSLPSTMDFIAKSGGPTNEALSQYVMALRSRQQPLDIFRQFEEAAGLPQQRRAAQSIRDQVYNLEDAIKGVEKQVAGTTRDSMVTEAQRQGMVQKTREPMLESYGTLSTNLSRLQSSITDTEGQLAQKVQLALQGQEQDLEPFKVKLDYLQNERAMMLTGFTSDKATRLELSLAKIRRGEQLDDREREEAFTLMRDEKAFQRELENQRVQGEQRMKEITLSSGLSLDAALKQLREGSRLSIEEANKMLPLTLKEYEEKKKLDRKYPAPKSGGDDGSSWMDFLKNTVAPTANASTTPEPVGIESPPWTPSQPGTVVSYGGVNWTSNSKGGWD